MRKAKNYSIRKIIFFILLISSFISVSLTVIIWFSAEMNDHKLKKNELIKRSVAEQKRKIKNEVLRVLDYINFKTVYSHNLPDSVVQKEILHYIENIRFGNDGYVFVNTFSGEALVFDGKIVKGKKNIKNMSDSEGFNIFKAELKAAQKKDGDYIEYKFKKMNDSVSYQKISYINSSKSLKWIVGAGDYVDNLTAKIYALNEKLNNETYNEIRIIIISFAGIILLILILSVWFSVKIKNQFRILNVFLQTNNAEKEKRLYEKMFISESKKVALELKKVNSEKNEFITIINHSLNEIYMFDSETFKFIYVNKGAEKNTGFSKNELLTMSPPDLITKIDTEDFKKLLSSLKSGEKSIIVFETVHVRKDKSEYPVEVHLQYSKFNNKAVFLAVILDITIQKAAVQNLKESEEKFRTLVYSMNDLVFLFDEDMKFVFYHVPDPDDLYLKPEEFSGKKPADVFSGILKEQFETAFTEVQNTLKSVTYEYQRDEYRNKKWYSLNMSPILKKNVFSGVIAIVRDISDIKSAEEGIIKLNNHLEQKVKQRTKELEDKNKDLEKFNELFVGREFRIKELKDQVKELEEKLNKI